MEVQCRGQDSNNVIMPPQSACFFTVILLVKGEAKEKDC
jgi:hypothetical protein